MTSQQYITWSITTGDGSWYMRLLAVFGKNCKWRIHETFLYWLSVIISAVYLWGTDYPLAISMCISCGNLSKTFHHKTRVRLKACLFSKLTINIFFAFTPDNNVYSPGILLTHYTKHEESHSTFIRFESLLFHVFPCIYSRLYLVCSVFFFQNLKFNLSRIISWIIHSVVSYHSI